MALESSFKNMVLSLTLVCVVCSALLGLVYGFTEAPIAAAAVAKTNNAISAVVPPFDNVPSRDMFNVGLAEGDSLCVYPAMKDGKPVGYAVESNTSKGFSGTVKVMVGFDAEGTIVGTSVLSHSETPGLGAKMTEPSFSGQFVGKNPATFKLSVKKDGGDIDAITAATISSRAYADALSRAYKAFCIVTSNNSAGDNDAVSGATTSNTESHE